MTDFMWTEERIDRLRSLFAENHTASEIAATLGQGLTRNAVCGKLARLGLNRGISIPVPSGRKPRVPKHEAKGAPTGSLAYKVIHGIKRKMAAAEVDPAPFVCRAVDTGEFLNLSIDQLTETTCRYPSATAPFTYCGQLIRDGSYCAEHFRLCHIGVPQRKSVAINPAEFGKSRGGVFGRVA